MGSGLEGALHDSFAEAGLDIELHLAEANGLSRILAKVAQKPLVIMGGGDGTLGSAAGILAEAGSTMAILPLGTRNHLARQLGLPLDLAEAAKVIAAGRTKRIDLGRVGDRVFVNNASVGLYTRLVRDREAMRLPKRLANIPAAWRVLRHLHPHSMQLSIDGQTHHMATPLLFIGNNRYSLEQGSVGDRQSLSQGELAFYAVAPLKPLQLIGMAVRTLIGRAQPNRDFCALETGTDATLAGSAALDVACDGEVERMRLPLKFTSLPRALEVVVP